LGEKPQVIALNKIDQPEVQERWLSVKAELEARGHEVVAISALARTDIRPVLMKAVEKLADTPTMEEVAPLPIYRVETDPNEFEISREDDASWRISGVAIERAAKMTYWEHYGSIRRFQKIMAALGIEKALREAGIEEGDTVHIDEYELEWQE